MLTFMTEEDKAAHFERVWTDLMSREGTVPPESAKPWMEIAFNEAFGICGKCMKEERDFRELRLRHEGTEASKVYKLVPEVKND